jgi:hypothetical protein
MRVVRVHQCLPVWDSDGDSCNGAVAAGVERWGVLRRPHPGRQMRRAPPSNPLPIVHGLSPEVCECSNKTSFAFDQSMMTNLAPDKQFPAWSCYGVIMPWVFSQARSREYLRLIPTRWMHGRNMKHRSRGSFGLERSCVSNM